MRAYFNIVEMKTPAEQTVIFSGMCREYFAAGLARAAAELTGNRIVVTRGQDLGKFVAEFPARTTQPSKEIGS